MEGQNRDSVPVPVFVRATQGGTVSVVNIERMHVPCDFNSMSMLLGPLVHVTAMAAIKVSQGVQIKFPEGAAGIYDTPNYYNLVRFIPAARNPEVDCLSPEAIPHWVKGDFSSRTTAPEVCTFSATGPAAGVTEHPTRGQWGQEIEGHFWTSQ